MENNDTPSKEFLERKALLDLEKEIVETRHRYKMEELQEQRDLNHSDHMERMSEIRLKNRNIQRSIEEKDQRIREYHEKKAQRFAQHRNDKPVDPQEATH